MILTAAVFGYVQATEPYNGWFADIGIGEGASWSNKINFLSYACGKAGNPTDRTWVSNFYLRLPRYQHKTKTNQYARFWRVNMGRLRADGRFKKFAQPESLIPIAWQQITNKMETDAKFGFVCGVTNENWNWRTNVYNRVK